MNEHLLRLAELKGIAPAYHDIWGCQHPATASTLTWLLVAMGVLGADDVSAPAIDAAIAEHTRRLRDELLPPVLVLHDGEPSWQLPLRARELAEAAHATPLAWRIDAEDGTVLQGPMASELAAAQRPACGYHWLSLQRDGETIAQCRLIVAPRTAYEPPALHGNSRLWGAAAQMYALRSERNWGIGDYTDLARLVELWGGAGAGVVGVSPMHAMFPHNPAHSSPYSPSSRLFLNLQYLDVEAIPDYRECADARALVDSAEFSLRLAALRRTDLVDHVGVAEAKRAVLERLYQHFCDQHLARGSERARDFEAFRGRRGAALRRHALFEALQAHFHRADNAVWGWPVWPEAYRDPDSASVAAFATEHSSAVGFYEYLQWQADLQLAMVGQRARECGLGVGLYLDLAVSVDRAGAEAWSHQAVYAQSASIGAPPDGLSPKGQNWGLPPLDPTRLRAAAYAPFIAMLRANMAHAGALRIDHVMSLMRLFWIPPGAEPSAGAYVHYPFDDLLGIVALESHRNRCLVIGEDLGTVPDEVRTKLAAAHVLSYRVLIFERGQGGAYKAPADYVRLALAVAATHDMAPLSGWWAGRDIELRARLGLFADAEQQAQQWRERERDRAQLLLALAREQLLPPGATADPQSLPALDAAGMCALHRYLARSPAQLVVAQLEDVLLACDQVNLPGTADEVPNWRRKLSLPLEQWAGDERFVELARALALERPRAAGAAASGAG